MEEGNLSAQEGLGKSITTENGKEKLIALSARSNRKKDIALLNAKMKDSKPLKQIPQSDATGDSSTNSEEQTNTRKKRQRRLFSDSPKKSSNNNNANTLQSKLENFLCKQYLPMRWVIYEWFYSNVDNVFYHRNDFQECLNELGLAKITRLTRPEWAYVRSIMGKPRRFSAAFLKDEKEKLYQNRIQVREQRTKPSKAEENVIRDVSVSLVPGEKIFALFNHGLHKGTVLSVVDDQYYRVQLEGGGEHVISDVDLATENIGGMSPVRNKKRKLPLSPKGSTPVKKRLLAENSTSSPSRSGMIMSPTSNTQTNTEISTPARLYVPSKSDLRSIAQLLRLLEKKEILLNEIKDMHNTAEKMNYNGNYPPQFQQQYAWLIINLEEVNKALEPSLLFLRSRRQQQLMNFARQQTSSFDLWYSDMTSKSKEEAITILNEAKKNLESQTADKNLNFSPQISELITSCLTLVLQLQACSEIGLSSFQLALAIDAAVNSCWPKCRGNTGIYQKLVTIVQIFKQALYYSK